MAKTQDKTIEEMLEFWENELKQVVNKQPTKIVFSFDDNYKEYYCNKMINEVLKFKENL